jgi:hypothetical protein
VASGTVYPDRDIAPNWVSSPGGPLYAVLNGSAGAFPPWYIYAWANGQSFACGITLPALPAGMGYSQLALSYGMDMGHAGSQSLGVLTYGEGSLATLASSGLVGDSGSAIWTPGRPQTAAMMAALGGLGFQVYVESGMSGNSSGPFVYMYPGGAYVNWTTAPFPAPIVTTDAADQVTKRSARLNGTINSRGYASTYHFEYGVDTTYGVNQTGSVNKTAETSGGSPSSATPVSATLSDLIPGQPLHYRLVLKNTDTGVTVNGADRTLTTNRAGQQLLL